MAVDWMLPHSSTYRLVLVDRSTGAESDAGDVLVDGGTLTRDDGTQVKESASVRVVGDFSPDPMLVRLYADVSQGGEVTPVALGTYVANANSSTYDGSSKVVSVELDGRLSELAGDSFDAPFTVEAGTPPVAYAKRIAEAAGFEVVADESTYALSQARSYALDEEQSKLDVINDLLDLAGFSAARTDEMGRMLMARYVEPSERPVASTYSSGDGTTMHEEVTDEMDSSSVANVVIVVYSTQDATVVGTAVDDDPTSRWSTVSRGRRIVSRYTYTDEVTQEQADAKAAELLATAQSAVRHVTFSAAYRPVRLADAVLMDYPESGVSGTFAVRSESVSLNDEMSENIEARAYVRG